MAILKECVECKSRFEESRIGTHIEWLIANYEVNKAAYGAPDLTEFGVEDLDERGERPTPLPVPPELRHRLRTAPYLCMPQAKSVRLHPNHLRPRSPLARAPWTLMS